MTARLLLALQMIFLVTVPLSTLLTTVAMLLPYWWSSDSFQVGFWRARSMTSSWIAVEPDTDTREGRLLCVLQLLSFASVLIADLSAVIWLTTLLRRTYHRSIVALISLFALTILTFFCLSTIVFFVWSTTPTHLDYTRLSYAFYLTLLLLLIHTLTLISLTLSLAHYRANQQTIHPNHGHEKLAFAFSEPMV